MTLRILGTVFVAGLSLTANSAVAADLGGDCCADLAERIEEFEKSAVRRGNRKLTLEISGQINQALLAWDDGGESDVYQVSNSHSGDRLRFTGAVAFSEGWKAGYFAELGLRLGSTGRVDQFNDFSTTSGVSTRQVIWFLENKKLGALSVGLGAPATDDLISYNLGGTNLAASANAPLYGGNFIVRDANEKTLNSLASGNTIPMRWRRFFERLDSQADNLIRYDSPIWNGFAASASWGGDDYWDVALRYAHVSRDFKIAAGIGYYEDGNEDEDTLGWPGGGDTEPNGGNTKIGEVKGSLSVLHRHSGLFASAAFVHRTFDGDDLGVLTASCLSSGDALAVAAFIGCSNRPDFDYYWVSGGIRRHWLPIGATSIYGEFGWSEGALTGLNVAVASAVGGDIDYVTDSSLQLWGVGLVQQVSSAAMEVYFSYRHLEADVRGIEASGAQVVAPLEDLDLFLLGSRIRF